MRHKREHLLDVLKVQAEACLNLRRYIPAAATAMGLAILLSACTANGTLPGSQAASNGQTTASVTQAQASTEATTVTETSATTEATPTPTPSPTPTPEPTPEPMVEVRAVYLSGPMAGVKIDHFIELANTTEINALVIDVKEGGIVNYASEVPLVQELGAFTKYMKVSEVLEKCHQNNIYVIGRIVCFRDDTLGRAKPEWAVQKASGGIWLEGSAGAWTNPSIAEVQQYNIDIAKEAVTLGFDEIQFDYVRFPTTTRKNPVTYAADMAEKKEVIASFLERACKEIKAVRDVPVTADIFGIVAESVKDGEAIGQHLETVASIVDAICPMVYPSHYANSGTGAMGNGVGQDINGVLFTAPDLNPHDVVYQTLLKIKSRSEADPAFKAVVRPYLQDFTATYIGNKAYYQEYGAKQIREQIQAVYDAGYKEWILWDGRNTYTESALLPGTNADAAAYDTASTEASAGGSSTEATAGAAVE